MIDDPDLRAQLERLLARSRRPFPPLYNDELGSEAIDAITDVKADFVNADRLVDRMLELALEGQSIDLDRLGSVRVAERRFLKALPFTEEDPQFERNAGTFLRYLKEADQALRLYAGFVAKEFPQWQREARMDLVRRVDAYHDTWVQSKPFLERLAIETASLSSQKAYAVDPLYRATFRLANAIADALADGSDRVGHLDKDQADIALFRGANRLAEGNDAVPPDLRPYGD